MTIKIEIEVPSDLVLKGTGGAYLDKAANALGWARGVSSVSPHPLEAPYSGSSELQSERDVYAEAAKAMAEQNYDQAKTILTNTPRAGESEEQTAARRERGKPSPGRARRTKEEIAEDEAADAADAAKQTAAEEANLTDDVKPAISTGGERISPEDEQDAADEAAETEKTGLASIDVLRRLVGDYQKKHGMPAAVKLCQEGGLIGKPIHELDDAGIEAAIAAMQGGEAPAKADDYLVHAFEEIEEAEPKTKADLIEAMMRYADKYDGTRDQAKMTHTLADMPKVFIATFGDGIDKLSKVAEFALDHDDAFAVAVAAVEAAIEADPYGRAK